MNGMLFAEGAILLELQSLGVVLLVLNIVIILSLIHISEPTRH